MANNTPEVRFEGFSGEWSQIRLGDKSIIKGRLGWKSLKQEEYLDNGPSMIAGRHIKNGEINWDIVDHIPQWRYDESPEIMLENGDVIFSKDGSLGNPALIRNLKVLATINSTMMLVRVDESLDSSFLYQVMKSEKFERLVYLKVSGSSIPHLFQADMNDFIFPSPTKEEQTKIGSFFKQLDDTIALQQQELDTLKQTKQGFLQKMFPKAGETVPEVRFPGFSGEWEERKLKDIANYRNGKAHEKNISENGNYIVINAKFVSTNGKVKKYSEEQIEPINKNEIAFVLSDVPNGRAIARTFLIKEDNKYSLNQRIAGITPNSNTNPYFLFILLNRHDYFLRFDDGVGQTNLSKANIENFQERYPSLEEQTKIGLFFKQLDDTITLHEQELDALKETKKAFLQKMFV